MLPNAEILLTFLMATIILLLLIVFIIVYASFFQKKRIQFMQEKATLQAQFTQELLQTQIEIQNATLQQISEELHDNIGQLLSVAKINLNILEETEQNSDNQEHIKQTNEIIGQSIQDLRLLTKSFDGDFVKDFGLEESLSQELLRIRKTNKYQTELLVSGERYTLGYESEIVLFRIAQEVLNNIMKHAQATRIEAQLSYEPKKFILCLTDNGKGFDYQSVGNNILKNSGAGLRNMRRRSELIGGKFVLNAAPGKGTRIEIEITLL